jgi:hypothetical protein
VLKPVVAILAYGALAAGCSRHSGPLHPAQDAAPRPSVGSYPTHCNLPNDDPACVGQFDLPPDMVEAAKHPIAPAPIIDEGTCSYKANVLNLYFKPGTTREELDRIAGSERGRVWLVTGPQATLELPTTTGEALKAAADRLKAHPQVAGATPNRKCGHGHNHERRGPFRLKMEPAPQQ